jgi:large subunit ribosomal protein L20
MPRVKRGSKRESRKQILKLAKGFYGRSKNCYAIAVNRVKRGLQHAYAHRRDLKSDMRSLWIVRINAKCRSLGMKYSIFMHLLKQHNLEINRKMLSEMAIHSPASFESLINLVSNGAKIQDKTIAQG